MARKVVSRATYWRRRVVVLAAGVAVAGLPIWAVNQALGGSRAPAQRPPRSSTAAASAPAGRGQPQARPRRTAPPGSGPRARPAASTATSRRPGPQACAKGGVLLTLRSGRHRYGPGEQVTFVIGAVATRSRPCRLNLGPTFTSVVVASGGAPLWDSSTCLRSTQSRVVILRRGTPAFLTVTWDRRTSLSGCPGQGTAAAAGTYTAAAFSGKLRSRATTFVLSGRSAARP